MPWVNPTICTGCGICVSECPVGAIALGSDHLAEINEDECIRCGRCHDTCPQEAVRHDSERIPREVAENLSWVRTLLKHFSTSEEQAAFMQRMERFFKKQIKVNEQTLAIVSGADQDNPAGAIDAALDRLTAGQVDNQASKG